MHSSEVIAQAAAHVAAGVSITDAARLVGVRRETVSRWLSGDATAQRARREASGAGGEVTLDTKCKSECDAIQEVDEAAYAYVLGLYLGDGCISQSCRSFRIRISQDPKYTGLVARCAIALGKVLPHNRVGVGPSGATTVIGAYTRHAICLFPQHGLGKKHLRKIELVEWQEAIVARHDWQFVAGLLHSDGCRAINRVGGGEYPRWHFSNVSSDIHGLYRASLDRLGIPWTIAGCGRETNVGRRAAVAEVDRNVPMKD